MDKGTDGVWKSKVTCGTSKHSRTRIQIENRTVSLCVVPISSTGLDINRYELRVALLYQIPEYKKFMLVRNDA